MSDRGNNPIGPPTAAEQAAFSAARDRLSRCTCGEPHSCGCGIIPEMVARMRGYLAEHPGHKFAADEEAGIIAVITAPSGTSGDLEVVAWACYLPDLLDRIGAPAAEGLS